VCWRRWPVGRFCGNAVCGAAGEVAAGLAVAGGLAWVASSIGGVLLARVRSPGARVYRARARVVESCGGAAPYVFVVGLTILLAFVLNALLTRSVWPCEQCVPIFAGAISAPFCIRACSICAGDVSDVLWWLRVCGGVRAAGWRVDINLFSLHGFYRNRLTRCYLGATRVGKPCRFGSCAGPTGLPGSIPATICRCRCW